MAVTLDATNAQIVNAVASEMVMFGGRIPETTAANIREVGNLIMSSEQMANEFLNVLVNRIARVIVNSRLYENPLASFKKGTERYGDTIEEIFVNIANASEYDPQIASREVYKREIPDVSAIYHKMNSKLVYKTTIQDNDLALAFTSENGMRTLVTRIVESLYSGANFDEFLSMKELFAANKPYFSYVVTDAPSATSAHNIVTNIKTASSLLTFMSEKYNHYGVKTHTPRANQILLLRADVDALIDVNVLASAFNMDKAEFMGRRIVVDNFGTGMDDVYAVLCDETFLMVVNNLDKFTEQYNGQGLYWNYFWHVWRTYGVSPFANAVAFTTTAFGSATGVTISPSAKTANKGDNIQFTANVAPSTVPQSVKYTASGMNGGSYITATGFLHVGEEQNGNITVTATSMYDDSKTSECLVTVS